MKYLQRKRVLNAGHPKGFWGAVTLINMNNDHASLTESGLAHANIKKDDVCLDIGCGGGRTVKRLSELTDNKVYGIDISGTSVKLSLKYNKDEVKSSRVKIKRGSASAIPFPDETFDVITAVETFYFWENKPLCLKNIYKALKKGGRLLILLDDYDDGTERQKEAKELIKLELNKIEDIENMLKNAGFTSVEPHIINNKSLCVLAEKE